MSFLSTKLMWLILQFFHIALSGIDDCTNQLKRVADTNDNPIVFNGTCYETGRDYAAPECQTWNVNVILALRSNTTESVLQEIENLISYTVKDCDYRSSLTFYMIGYSEYECGMKCEIGSLECENLLHRINLTTASINITDNGDVIVRFFENLSKCANSSTFIQGGAVFFITNVPCMSMCTQLYAVIAQQRKITNIMNSIGYVFRIVYFDDIDDFHHNPTCQVKMLFDYSNTYAGVFEINGSWEIYAKRLHTCPSKSSESESLSVLLKILLFILIPLICLSFCVGMVTICWKRTITARSMRSLFAAAHSIRNDVRALHFTTGLDIFSKEHFTNVFSTESEKYRDAKMIDDWEIAEENLLVIKNEILGKGAFSICYKGILKGRLPINRVFKTLNLTFDMFANTDSEVAVKVLPAYADDINRANFLHEIEFMKNLGYHTHIISLIGCVSNRFAPKIVTELCANGDVLRFLRTNKSRFVLEDRATIADDGFHLHITDLVSIAWQVCDGMCYLSCRNLIHRDLAARNVLLTRNFVAKIGDFGLCRYTDQALYNTQGGRLPIKWMAIESLKWYEYTTKSDVWSYGVFLFEVFSLGDRPFACVQPQEMITFLEKGHRNEKPINCPDEIYELMKQCWQESPQRRPTFTQISAILSEILRADDAANDYLSMIAEPSEHDGHC